MPDSPSEPRWLTAEEVIAINAYEVAATGEPFVLRDRGTLDGALARPLSRFLYEAEEDVAILAVTLLMAIAKAHAFAQGNKRTAFFAAGAFLRVNGYRLDLPDTVVCADILVGAVEGTRSVDQVEELFADSVVPVEE